MEGRVEIRHHGIWGTVCDDDFSNLTATVICRSLGYGGSAVFKKNGFFGPGKGPIWLDEVKKLNCQYKKFSSEVILKISASSRFSVMATRLNYIAANTIAGVGTTAITTRMLELFAVLERYQLNMR